MLKTHGGFGWARMGKPGPNNVSGASFRPKVRVFF